MLTLQHILSFLTGFLQIGHTWNMTSKMNLVESYAQTTSIGSFQYWGVAAFPTEWPNSSHYLLRWHPREEALTDFCICDLILYSEFVAIIKKQLDQLVNQKVFFHIQLLLQLNLPIEPINCYWHCTIPSFQSLFLTPEQDPKILEFLCLGLNFSPVPRNVERWSRGNQTWNPPPLGCA